MRTRPALAAAALVTVLMATGCATPTEPAAPPATSETSEPAPTDPTTTPEPTEPVVVELTVTRGVDPGSGASAEAATWTLTCDPAGGTHPTAQEACDLIAAAGRDLFAPVPGDVMCTEIYGGPEVAHVVGTVGGEPVDARFTRTNGCEIDRWDSAEALIGAPGQ